MFVIWGGGGENKENIFADDMTLIAQNKNNNTEENLQYDLEVMEQELANI